jgi:DNA modification methylase
MTDNILYYGDNLDVLRRYIKDETIDLIYLDPPFKSDATYNVLFAEQNGTRAAAQVKAFEDTWQWDRTAARAFTEVVEAGGKLSKLMQSFWTYLGGSDMLAYLAMMAPRLVELRRVLKSTGSIYLHCDPTASHYLKMLMDAIFGGENFQNEIVWYYRGAGISKKRFARRHDIILFYGKSDNLIFNPDEVRTGYAEATIDRFRHYIGNVRKGKDFGLQRLHPKGKHPDDVWEISIVAPSAKERVGYPTQKPEALLERIIKASSNEGDLVLDPFCGCGTTIAVAQRLNRRWIGIDITHLAVTLIKHRLQDAFGDNIKNTYKVIGEPVSLPDAETLAKQDPYQFQWWALGLVGARPVEQKKGADKGIDGRLYFHDEGEGGKTKQIILSVKAGHTGVAHIRDLRGVIDRENAEIGVLITMQEPTQQMRAEAADAGFYQSPGWNKNYPKLQILSVPDLLAGKGIDMPPLQYVNRTFKKAPRAKGKSPKNLGLLL